MSTVLAYRFSAFGDVAMAAIVIREFVEQNPDVRLVMVSREHFKPLFGGIPNLFFKGVNLDDFKGFFGMQRLATQLIREFSPTHIADLHDVIRTKILDRKFARKGFNVAVIDKGKEEKEILTDIWNLEKQQLRSTVERYADVFRELGFGLTLSHKLRTDSKPRSGVGFAPFAQHKGKMLPLDKSYELARLLAKKYEVYFFGGGKDETETLSKWEKQIPNTRSLAGSLTLSQELEKISCLDVMISMDSANMHLASLAGTRCISVWGSTHHFAGFLGYGQSEDDIVQVKDLTCRPCSVFGDRECFRGDYACLQEIHIQQILNKL